MKKITKIYILLLEFDILLIGLNPKMRKICKYITTVNILVFLHLLKKHFTLNSQIFS